MDDLYLVIRDDIMAAWNLGWTHPDVPVFWNSNSPLPDPDPLGGNGHPGSPHFFRNDIDFGREEIIAFGGGRNANLRVQYGSVIMRSFTSVVLQDEDTSLQLMSAAMAVWRGYRSTDAQGNDLSFIGSGSGFDSGPTDDGVWFMRGSLAVFEYRFPG
jgi:hypothetical protein